LNVRRAAAAGDEDIELLLQQFLVVFAPVEVRGKLLLAGANDAARDTLKMVVALIVHLVVALVVPNFFLFEKWDMVKL
jgi:hypothetical protein